MDGIITLGRSDERGQLAMTSTLGPTSSIAGARMNTPRQVSVPPSFSANLGTESSVSKLCNCSKKIYIPNRIKSGRQTFTRKEYMHMVSLSGKVQITTVWCNGTTEGIKKVYCVSQNISC